MLHLEDHRTPAVTPQLPPSLSALLPLPLREGIRLCGAPVIEELRLHSDRYAGITAGGKSYLTHTLLTGKDLEALLQRLCGGSLYAYAESICRGYFTLRDGVRVGVCGQAALEGERVIGVSRVTGLILRIPHTLQVSAKPILSLLEASKNTQGLLLYAPPGGGKTTMLRAIAREAAAPPTGYRTVVIDSRGELSDTLGGRELSLDILVGYPRELGIGIAVRSLGASLILCDEIGDERDAEAILRAANCGVPIIATAHASGVEELLFRPGIRRLHEAHAFSAYVGLERIANEAFHLHITKRKECDL